MKRSAHQKPVTFLDSKLGPMWLIVGALLLLSTQVQPRIQDKSRDDQLASCRYYSPSYIPTSMSTPRVNTSP